MKMYQVLLPITGYCLVIVEAENPESALKIAHETADTEHLETWTTHDKIVEKNIFNGSVNEYDIREIEE